MKRLPLSVLMCVHNGDINYWLDMSILSILSQTYGQFSFIIVDDASIDKTPQILQRYARKDNRIKIISLKKNIGLTKALNHGLNYCDGENIARQDADDISHPQRLEKQYSLIEKDNPIGVVGCFYDIIDRDGIKKDNRSILPQSVPLSKMNGIFAGGSAMIRWEVIQDIDGYNNEFIYAQDFDMWVRASLKGWKIESVPELLYYWRTHKDQISYKSLGEQQNCRWGIIKKYKL